MYFSAAIGFARTSGRRRSVATSDGRRGGGGGTLVARRATTRPRGDQGGGSGCSRCKGQESKRRAMSSGYFESPSSQLTY